MFILQFYKLAQNDPQQVCGTYLQLAGCHTDCSGIQIRGRQYFVELGFLFDQGLNEGAQFFL